MTLRLPAQLLAAIERHAGATYPAECCGLLLGSASGVADEVLPAANLDPEPRHGYFIDPRTLLAGHRQARLAGRRVVGYYHSHPEAPAVPSARDRAEALSDVSYLILPLVEGQPGAPRSFRAGASGLVEELVVIGMSAFDRLAGATLEELEPAELRRYGRHLVIPEVGFLGQKKLKASRVLLVGAGGLGSPLALYLAAAGVGRLGIVEFDRVDESNLQRQVLYGQSDLGRPKLEAAVARLRDVNPTIEITPHPVRLGKDNALALIGEYDLVADGSDNFATRYLVNDACVLLGKPDVYGSIFRFEGQLSVFWAARGPCYRCLFPEPPPPGLVPSCAEGGVLGVLPGIIGTLQANEVIKLLLGIGEPMIGRFLTFDALRMRFRELRLQKSADCPICSPAATQRELIEYTELCGMPATETTSAPASAGEGDAMEESAEPMEVSVQDAARWRAEGRDFAILDVREPAEHAISRIEGATLLPLRQLPQRLGEIDPERPLLVYCHYGMRSLQAVHLLRSRGFGGAVSLVGGIDAWSREVDPAVPRY